MSLPPALVTGAPGWLGTRLVRALALGLPDVPALAKGQDREIRVLVRPGTDPGALPSGEGKVRVVRGDLTAPASLAAFVEGAAGATVFHAAGVIHPRRSVREFYAVNVEGTRNLLAAARRAGVRRFVHVSSNSPLGFNPAPDHLFDESSPYRPYRNYGRSKKIAEDLVNAAHGAGGMETVIVRAPWFYGPDQPERQSRFIRMVKEGRFPLVGDGRSRRSLAYVDNLCHGLLLAETVAGAAGRTYWIADARPYTMNEIVDTIAAVLAEDYRLPTALRRLRLPGWTSDLARLADGAIQALGLYQQEIHVLSEMGRDIACSIARARVELGYEPQVALREGMRRSVAWMLEHGVPL